MKEQKKQVDNIDNLQSDAYLLPKQDKVRGVWEMSKWKQAFFRVEDWSWQVHSSNKRFVWTRVSTPWKSLIQLPTPVPSRKRSKEKSFLIQKLKTYSIFLDKYRAVWVTPCDCLIYVFLSLRFVTPLNNQSCSLNKHVRIDFCHFAIKV